MSVTRRERQAEQRLGLLRRIARCVPDTRNGSRVEHSREEQVRQRVLQIVMGYEDCNDADWLRRDPMLMTVCDRLPQSDAGLSSQPSLSRFENAVTGQSLRKMLQELESSYVEGLPADTHRRRSRKRSVLGDGGSIAHATASDQFSVNSETVKQ